MADTIPFSATNIAANSVVNSDTTVANSRYNPVEQTSRVSVYAVANAANGANLTFSIGGQVHTDDAPIFFNTNLALSTRDNLIGSALAFKGQKITIGYRETGGVATTDLSGLVIVEPA